MKAIVPAASAGTAPGGTNALVRRPSTPASSYGLMPKDTKAGGAIRPGGSSVTTSNAKQRNQTASGQGNRDAVSGMAFLGGSAGGPQQLGANLQRGSAVGGGGQEHMNNMRLHAAQQQVLQQQQQQQRGLVSPLAVQQQHSSGPVYGTTPNGEKYPVDLMPYLAKGTPLKISPICKNHTIKYFASRFPAHLDLMNLQEPVMIQRDSTQLHIANDPGAPPEDLSEQVNNFRRKGGYRSRSTKLDPAKLPWRVTDSNEKSLIGRKSNLDTSTHFIMIDKGSHCELIPLDGWYTFLPDAVKGAGDGGATSSDLAERKRRAVMRKEEEIDASFMTKLKGAGDDDGPSTKRKRAATAGALESAFAEDAGLNKQKKKKWKSMVRARKDLKKHDDEDVGDSALNLGHLKKAEVDWDWEDDGKATDDEEDIGGGDDAEVDAKDEFQESDEEESNLTKLGQQVTSALENQKEVEADDELAQFSDDDEAEEGGEAAESVEGGTPGKESGASGSADRKAGAAITSAGAATGSKSSSQVGSGSSPGGKSKKGAKEATGKPTSPGKNSESGMGAGSAAGGQSSSDVLRRRVIRTLNLHGGRLPTKEFIQSFNLTQRNEHFKLIQKIINEVCEVHTERSPTGEQVKVLELQAQYRQK